MFIEESFDTIFNMVYGSGKSAMDERVKKQQLELDLYAVLTLALPGRPRAESSRTDRDRLHQSGLALEIR